MVLSSLGHEVAKSASATEPLQLSVSLSLQKPYQASVQSPLCYVARITFLVPSSIAAVHQNVPEPCWVGVGGWFGFFRGTTIVTYKCIQVITRGNEHVFWLPTFFWYNIQLNLWIRIKSALNTVFGSLLENTENIRGGRKKSRSDFCVARVFFFTIAPRFLWRKYKSLSIYKITYVFCRLVNFKMAVCDCLD